VTLFILKHKILLIGQVLLIERPFIKCNCTKSGLMVDWIRTGDLWSMAPTTPHQQPSLVLYLLFGVDLEANCA